MKGRSWEFSVGWSCTDREIDAIDKASADGAVDPYQLQQTVRRVVGRWVNKAHRRRPMIIPVVIEA